MPRRPLAKLGGPRKRRVCAGAAGMLLRGGWRGSWVIARLSPLGATGLCIAPSDRQPKALYRIA